MSESNKIGRGKRSAARTRYKAASRWDANKRKNIAKAAKAAATPKVMKVPRGTARAKRRVALQWS